MYYIENGKKVQKAQENFQDYIFRSNKENGNEGDEGNEGNFLKKWKWVILAVCVIIFALLFLLAYRVTR